MNINEFLGKTFTKIDVSEDEIIFHEGHKKYKMYNSQDCCEYVYLEDVVGKITDLIGSPITMAEEVTNSDDPMGKKNDIEDSFTWTFYKLATIKGYVTLRWFGSSNGYYSELVDIS